MNWMEDAVCATVDGDLWFPAVGQWSTVNTAKRICGTCPVRNECLTTALADPSLDGVWGGTTVMERTQLRARMSYVYKGDATDEIDRARWARLDLRALTREQVDICADTQQHRYVQHMESRGLTLRYRKRYAVDGTLFRELIHTIAKAAI